MGKKIFRFLGKVILVLGLLLFLVGGAFGILGLLANDEDGYAVSGVHEVRSDTCCYFLAFLPDRSGWFELEHRLWVEPKGGNDLLVGWLWFSDMDKVTTHRSYETPKNWYRNYNVLSQGLDIPDGVAYNQGLLGPTLSGNESFWMWARTIKDGGSSSLALDLRWEPDDAMKTLVFMNKDGSEGVSVDISYGTRSPLLLRVPLPLMGGGTAIIVLGAALTIMGRKE